MTSTLGPGYCLWGTLGLPLPWPSWVGGRQGTYSPELKAKQKKLSQSCQFLVTSLLIGN